MHGLLKQPGYRLHPPDSPEARALLAEQGLGPADLERALAPLASVARSRLGGRGGFELSVHRRIEIAGLWEFPSTGLCL